MVEESVLMDIRKLLKTFGVQADAAIIQHMQQHPELKRLHLRVRLEDLTVYPTENAQPLSFCIEGDINRDE